MRWEVESALLNLTSYFGFFPNTNSPRRAQSFDVDPCRLTFVSRRPLKNGRHRHQYTIVAIKVGRSTLRIGKFWNSNAGAAKINCTHCRLIRERIPYPKLSMKSLPPTRNMRLASAPKRIWRCRPLAIPMTASRPIPGRCR